MPATDDSQLRALIRLIPPVKALKDDLEESLHMELYEGTGNLALQSFRGLQASVTAITDDPYVKTLNLEIASEASDKEKVSLARLAAGQLAAYLEGQTGLVSLGGEGSKRSYQTAPNITINGINGVPNETIEKIVDIGAKAMENKAGAPTANG